MNDGDSLRDAEAKNIDVVALGELLVDFTQVASPDADRPTFEQNPGGAPANMVATCARFGLACEFIGKVGADAMGDYLTSCLEGAGVGTSNLMHDKEVFTTIAFVQVDHVTGERTFSFARKPGADTQLTPDELDAELISHARLLHVGSLSLTDEPARSATEVAVRLAHAGGALVSYDPNYRPNLWPDAQQAVTRMGSLIGQADLMKVSLEEAVLLTGDQADGSSHDAVQPSATAGATPNDVTTAVLTASELLRRGPRLVAVTLGSDGAFIATKTASAFIPPCPPRSLTDTTGAGDVFWGSFVSWLLRDAGVRTAADLDALDGASLTTGGTYACTAASISVERRGGLPSIPSPAEILERLG